MLNNYNDQSELQGSVFPHVRDVVLKSSIFEKMKLEKSLRIAEFACATGGNSKAYIDFFKKSLEVDNVEVIFNDLEKNPWDAFEIDETDIPIEFAKGSMYEIKIEKEYDIGFSNSGLQWTTLEKSEKKAMPDAIWIQESDNEALKAKVAKQSKTQLSNFLKLRHSEISNNGVLVLSIWTKPLIGQKFMNEAKRAMVEQETDEEVRNMLIEKLNVNEYFRTEDEILDALAENNNLWENVWMEYREIPCYYDNTKDKNSTKDKNNNKNNIREEGKKNRMNFKRLVREFIQRKKGKRKLNKMDHEVIQRRKDAMEMFKSFCNFGLEEEYEEKFWDLAENLAGGFLSTAGGTTVLILKKLQMHDILQDGDRAEGVREL